MLYIYCKVFAAWRSLSPPFQTFLSYHKGRKYIIILYTIRCLSHPLPSLHVCRVIVGAPRANSTYSSSVHSPGAVYKCRVHSNPERRCTEMDLGRGQSPTACSINTTAHNDIYTNCSLVHVHTHTHISQKSCPHTPMHAELSCSFSLSTQVPQASVLFYQNNAALYCS